MEPAGEYRGGGSTVALVICIIIAVVGVLLAFVFYSKWDEQLRTIEDQGQQLADVGDQVKSLQAERDQWTTKSGFDTNVALETAVAAVPDVVPATAKRALELLEDRARQASRLAEGTEAKYQTASQELENLRNQLNDTQEAKDGEIQRLDEEKATMEADFKKQVKERDDLLAQLRDQKRAAEDEALEAKDLLEEATASFKRLEMGLKARMVQMQDKLRIIEEKAEDPDGYIVAFDNDTGYGSINLGGMDHVQPGMIFQVYNVGRGGKVIDKGRIQVRRVEGKSSVIGVIESVPDRPVTKGDYVMTALLAKEKPTFVVAGWFPPAVGYTPEQLRFLVERWGGEVAQEVSLDTDYLVVGEIRVAGEEVSPEAQKRAAQGLDAYNLARELAVRILDVEDFVKLVQR